MKGIVFVQFIELVENEFGFEMADEIIESATLATNGSYTAVGTYDHSELIQLVGNLSNRTKIPVSQLMVIFGEKMFEVLTSSHPNLVNNFDGVFSVLKNVEDIIHVEVKKLYPDAELPTFKYSFSEKNRMELIYTSPRPFADFAKGLILGCIAHYDEPVVIKSVETLSQKENQIRFVLEKKG